MRVRLQVQVGMLVCGIQRLLCPIPRRGQQLVLVPKAGRPGGWVRWHQQHKRVHQALDACVQGTRVRRGAVAVTQQCKGT